MFYLHFSKKQTNQPNINTDEEIYIFVDFNKHDPIHSTTKEATNKFNIIIFTLNFMFFTLNITDHILLPFSA